MKKLLALSTGALALLATGYLWSSRGGEPSAEKAPEALSPSPSPAAGNQELQRMNRELSSLQRELAALRGQVAVQVQPDEDDAPPVEQKPSSASQNESWRAQMEEVSSAFEQEPVDPQWAGRMSAT